MKNKIKIIPWCTQYSRIRVTKTITGFDPVISEHIVSNNGWFPLEFWVKYFTYEF